MNLSRQAEPRYMALANTLRSELTAYAVGDYLPAEVRLAERFGVNRHTLRRAVDELVAEGRVLRHKGRGTCVLAQRIVYPVHAGSAYSKTLTRMGFRSEAVLLGRKDRIATPEERKELALADSDRIVELKTLRLLDDQPISLITHCFSTAYRHILQTYEGGSLRLHMEKNNISLKRISTLIGAREPTQADAIQLLMPRRTPVLTIRTVSANSKGRPLELSRSITRADRFTYHVISGEHHEQ